MVKVAVGVFVVGCVFHVGKQQDVRITIQVGINGCTTENGIYILTQCLPPIVGQIIAIEYVCRITACNLLLGHGIKLLGDITLSVNAACGGAGQVIALRNGCVNRSISANAAGGRALGGNNRAGIDAIGKVRACCAKACNATNLNIIYCGHGACIQAGVHPGTVFADNTACIPRRAVRINVTLIVAVMNA